MLLSLKDLSGYLIDVKEGEIGKIDQFYFDDENWTVRYVVVETGPWFGRTKVLVSPHCVEKIDFLNHRVIIQLTRDQLLKSPDIDTEKPISRQMEMRYLDHYRWPYYWTGSGTWGTAAILDDNLGKMPENEDENHYHLRATKEVLGYHVESTDAEFGRVDDFIIDESCWGIRYLEIHLRKLFAAKTVLISREWVESVSWKQRTVRVSVSQDEIKTSPEYKTGAPLARDYEELLHRHYSRERYWERKKPKSAA